MKVLEQVVLCCSDLTSSSLTRKVSWCCGCLRKPQPIREIISTSTLQQYFFQALPCVIVHCSKLARLIRLPTTPPRTMSIKWSTEEDEVFVHMELNQSHENGAQIARMIQKRVPRQRCRTASAARFTPSMCFHTL